jgi:hypothetical protein
MALTPPPQRTKKQPTEAQIEAVVSRGGQVAQLQNEPEDAIKHVNTRLTAGVIRQIDELRAKRPRKMGSPKVGISLRDWIVEAVLEKLARDSKK